MLLYTNNGLSEREIKKIMPFIIASKRIKYLGINLTKELKSKDSKKTLNIWKLSNIFLNNLWVEEEITVKTRNILTEWQQKYNTPKLVIYC